MKTTGNTILVTGGGSGIGLCIVRELLQRDNKVMICGRNEEKLEHDKYEILVGQSKSLSLISRLAPNFIEKQLADAFS